MWCEMVAIVVVELHVAPPLVEWKAPTAVSLALSVGTITVPSGRTTGWPPMTPVPLPLRRRPVLATIARRAHLQQVPSAVVVPLGVAVAIERAGRGVVADDPVLVQIGCRSLS